MSVEIEEIGIDLLPRYAQIPIAFEVRSLLRVELVHGGLGGITLREEEVMAPYAKDYDAHEAAGPEKWPARFDTRQWGIFLVHLGGQCVGGATVAFDTAGIHMLEGRSDLAVLWDIRVYPDLRRRGIGTALFQRAADWSRRRGCKQLKIETQNVNVPACRFYARQGCELGEINRYGYAGHPEVEHEVRLIWYLEL
jgi:GNAT superfamily N-acetyltransferase